MEEINKDRTENFNEEIFPELDISGYYKDLAKKLECNLNSEGKYITIESLYEKKNKKNYFQSDTFNEQFPDFEGKKLSGLYVFGKPNNKGEYIPVYVGISRDLKRRMSEHLLRYDKYNSTWAYLMITKKKKTLEDKEAERQIKKKKEEYFGNLRITFHPIENNFELHLTEVLISILLKSYWNSFKTT